MENKLIVEISEGLGNQLFMYSHSYALSKKLKFKLLIDETSGYSLKKNRLRNHQLYLLDKFSIEQNYAPLNYKYDTYFKKIIKKTLIILDNFNSKKKFLIEKNKKINGAKIAQEFIDIDQNKISNELYVQGNYENCRYFENFRNELIKIFKPKDKLIDFNNPIIDDLKKTNSVSIHIRRNRFTDQKKLSDNIKNIKKSFLFTNQIINYVNKSIEYIKDKVDNPKFFIWSNDFNNFNEIVNKIKISDYAIINTNDVINDFNLFRYSKHFIVGPSSFHWWGAWLNENPEKLCLRPSNLSPSNNKAFWPEKWIKI